MIAETHGTGGSRGGSQFPLPYVYDVPASSRTHTDVFVNGGDARAMRAPGHPQGCAIMEAAMDDLADKLGIDPLEFRLKNLAAGRLQDPDLRGRGRDRGRADRLEAEPQAARPERQGADQARPRHGPAHRGAAAARQDKQVTCIINPDGSVELKSATQDIGTGARTSWRSSPPRSSA